MIVIDKVLIDALLTLHKKLGCSNVNWAVGGDLGEALRGVETDPDSVEIIIDNEDALNFIEAVREFNPTEISLSEQRLPREATLGGKKFPVYSRSNCFEFNIGSVRVKVQSDLRYKVGDWDWGDPLEFEPEYVYVVGEKTAVLPLSLKAELYGGLGWMDRVEKIKQATTIRRKKN